MFIIFLISGFVHAAPETATSMVPRGKLVENYGRDFIIKTTAGTKIGIEFTLGGKLQEASGKNLNQGDELEPGEGLISLSSAAHKLTEKGLKPQGYWTLEEDKSLGWIYELEESIVEAKSGKILKLKSSSPLSLNQ